MDALVMSAISRSFPHLGAALVVIAVHAAIALWLLQPRQPRPTDNGPRTSLRWLPPRPVPPPLKTTHAASQADAPAKQHNRGRSNHRRNCRPSPSSRRRPARHRRPWTFAYPTLAEPALR
ncbi:hypothetical protein ABE493_04745 [Stenotrophomonas terrae]|uniref:hypothetical protein n=1 Tax=Stenotrophomonas terrae TaxID=405446 RepID=UPI003208AB7E